MIDDSKSTITQFSIRCVDCNRSFTTHRGFKSHWVQVHKPNRKQRIRDYHGDKNPHFGHRHPRDLRNVAFNTLTCANQRLVLFEEANYACVECGFNKRRPDGHTVLEVHHIDGNHFNNEHNNLRVLCPNCHSMTPFYKGHARKSNEKSPHKKAREDAKLNSLKLSDKFNSDFIAFVEQLIKDKTIDFTQIGWVNKLAIMLDELPQITGRRMRRLMPQFYNDHCFFRGKRIQKR
jgi:5-methylcytosine-specific restriction endonuclease McrA